MDVVELETAETNSASYTGLHNAQIFQDGLSFSGYERDKVFVGDGASGFVDLSDLSGADSQNDGRAVLAADLDDDGDVDLFVHELQRERHALYRNDLGADAGFVKLRMASEVGDAGTIGATVAVSAGGRTAAQVLSRGAGFESCQVPELVFGLGGAETAEVRVLWPGETRAEAFGPLASGARVTLVRGSGEAASFEARPRALADPLPPGLALEEGDLLPRLSARDADGAEVVLDLVALAQGGPLYLNLWGSYCGGCVAEIAALQELHASDRAEVVAISTDVAAQVPAADALLRRRGARFPGLYLGAGGRADAPSIDSLIDLDRLVLPTTIVLSAEGRVEAILAGPLSTGDE